MTDVDRTSLPGINTDDFPFTSIAFLPGNSFLIFWCGKRIPFRDMIVRITISEVSMADRANAKSDPATWISDCIREYAGIRKNSLHLGGGREPHGMNRSSDFPAATTAVSRVQEDIGPLSGRRSRSSQRPFPMSGPHRTN
jgi:hypothetical protein